MLKKLMVPLDGSELAERALPFAAVIARSTGAEVSLVRVARTHPHDDDEELSPAFYVGDWLGSELAGPAAMLLDAGIDADTKVLFGDPASAIAQAALEESVDLVVMSSHGRGGMPRWVLGSVAEEFVRDARLPLFVVPRSYMGDWSDGPPLRVLLALDGSDLAEAAIAPAVELAQALGARIVLVRAVAPTPVGYAASGETGIPLYFGRPDDNRAGEAREYLEEVASRADLCRLVLTVRAENGPAATVIARVAREESAGLVAMATHGRGALGRLVLGSVAMSVLEHGHLPVTIVRPAAMQGTAEESRHLATVAS